MELLLQHATQVMNDLGTGHREGIYAKALNVSLNKYNVPHRSEVDIPIMYMGQCVGHGRADLIIDDLIVEIKAVFRPPKEAMGQLQKYVTNLSAVERRKFKGVILNFCQHTGTVSVFVHEDRRRITAPPVVKSRFFQRACKAKR